MGCCNGPNLSLGHPAQGISLVLSSSPWGGDTHRTPAGQERRGDGNDIGIPGHVLAAS